MNKWLLLILFFFILTTGVFSQNKIDDSALYFSFKKINEKLIISLEGYIIYNKTKINLKDLNYEWKIDFGDNYEKIKTYQPYIAIDDIKNAISGVVVISGKNIDFSFEKFFNFTNKNLPKVVIAKYNKKHNLALPLTKLNPDDNILYPLVYNFSSDNLAYVWTVNDSQYYNSYLLDISALSGENKINLRVYNLDNQSESASDEVVINK